jgi:hypothetical protein
MDLYISGQLAQTWNRSGSEVYYWDTTRYPDGICLVKLIVYDKANNTGEKEVLVNIDNVVPGWTLSLIAMLGLIAATLIGTWAYSAKWKRERGQPYFSSGSRFENRVAKPLLRLAIILQALWYGFWIAAEILVWHKPLNVALMSSSINDFGFISAILLLLLFEILQRHQFTKSAQT